MGSMLSVLIELAVIVLLALTVGYCVILDRKLQGLRANEQAMRRTVAELGETAARAERALETLRAALTEGDRDLQTRLGEAEQLNGELRRTIEAGGDVLARMGRIIAGARRAVDEMDARTGQPAAPAPQPSARAVSDTVAAAEAFAERARRRMLPDAA